jgi:hypothetical protein
VIRGFGAVFVAGQGFFADVLDEREDFAFVAEAAGFGGVGVVEAGDAVVRGWGRWGAVRGPGWVRILRFRVCAWQRLHGGP